jgi:hypothetical protein
MVLPSDEFEPPAQSSLQSDNPCAQTEASKVAYTTEPSQINVPRHILQLMGSFEDCDRLSRECSFELRSCSNKLHLALFRSVSQAHPVLEKAARIAGEFKVHVEPWEPVYLPFDMLPSQHH